MAAHAPTTSAHRADIWFPPPSNENAPDKKADRWRQLIDGMKAISPAVAICCIRAKLSGCDVDCFCTDVLTLLEARV